MQNFSIGCLCLPTAEVFLQLEGKCGGVFLMAEYILSMWVSSVCSKCPSEFGRGLVTNKWRRVKPWCFTYKDLVTPAECKMPCATHGICWKLWKRNPLWGSCDKPWPPIYKGTWLCAQHNCFKDFHSHFLQ